ncbi:AI-2E family transporter [Derxia lacustris]|uniref:AI-2E family transporter n=1 Tax=Derxia lacustris TaxID=764842 RepID=UPI000A171A3A|nr:AI-2E family transporter [Derxia lacustris]
MRTPALPQLLPPHWLLTGSCLIALLHFGREVLQPLALAAVLSLVLSPLIRRVRRLGLGHTPATLVSVLLAGAVLAWAGIALAVQVAAVVADLPGYREGIRIKIEQVRETTVRPFERWEADLIRLAPSGAGAGTEAARAPGLTGAPAPGQTQQPVPVQIREPRPTPSEALSRLLAALSGPLGMAGIVLVLTVFMSLEHESLRDRILRLTGEAELASTVQALANAAEGVSRFFATQFVVNFCFAVVLGLALWLLGVPHAVLWAALGGLLRFVPYVGILVAGGLVALFTGAVAPGWALMFASVAVLLLLELLLAHVIEPQVYGHSSGLTPLAVIVAALFWGALWGPVGLLLSTPLTLCLVVAGRHVRALAPIAILLGDTPGSSQGQRFYQRLLVRDTDAILRDACLYLRRGSIAKYCDHVLLPGVALAAADYGAGRIGAPQREQLRATITQLAATLGELPTGGGFWRRRATVSFIDASIGAHLRRMREERLGRWQGSLDVPAGSVVICAGFSAERDELLTELLVWSLRSAGVDARSVALDRRGETPETDSGNLVSTVFLTWPQPDRLDDWQQTCRALRQELPRALLVTVRPTLDASPADESAAAGSVDLVLHSFSEAVAFVLDTRAGAQASSSG